MPQTRGELVPRDLGEIIGETFRRYRAYFAGFLGIAAVWQAVSVIGVLQPAPQAVRGLPEVVGIVGSAVASVAGIAGTGALVYALSQSYLKNRVPIIESYRFVLGKFWSLLGAGIMAGIVVLLLAITIVGIPFAIYVGVRWSFISQTIILEGVDARRALSRSSAVVRGDWWRVFGIAIVLGLLVLPIAAIPLSMFFLAPDVSPWVARLISCIAGAFLAPVSVIGMTLLYWDLRVRKESYTLSEEEELKDKRLNQFMNEIDKADEEAKRLADWSRDEYDVNQAIWRLKELMKLAPEEAANALPHFLLGELYTDVPRLAVIRGVNVPFPLTESSSLALAEFDECDRLMAEFEEYERLRHEWIYLESLPALAAEDRLVMDEPELARMTAWAATLNEDDRKLWEEWVKPRRGADEVKAREHIMKAADYRVQGRYEDAAEEVDKAEKLAPDVPWLYRTLCQYGAKLSE